MDGDHLTTGEPSQHSIDAPPSLGDMFTQICPQYMVMGMTYDEFWHRPTTMHKAIRETWEIRRKNDEWARWRSGLYFYDALMCAAPVIRPNFGKGKVEPGKYPDEPWPLTDKEAREREEAHAQERFMRYLEQMNAESVMEKRRRADESVRKEAMEDG